MNSVTCKPLWHNVELDTSVLTLLLWGLVGPPGLRDRCPEGRYVMIASLYDKLGGQALRWHKLHGQEWHGSTVPFEHDGQSTSLAHTSPGTPVIPYNPFTSNKWVGLNHVPVW